MNRPTARHCRQRRPPAGRSGEDPLQSSLYRAALLVAAGFQAEVVARMVVKDSQRMAAAAVTQRDPALEVHLPQQVWRWPLEALLRRSSTRRRNNAAIPAQHLVQRRNRRRCTPFALQTTGNLAPPPRPDGHRAPRALGPQSSPPFAPGSSGDAETDRQASRRSPSGRATCTQWPDGYRTGDKAPAGSSPPASQASQTHAAGP